ncbi:MAG: shikimate kinase [Bacteroidales bacterium]|nr:shikimate kinase [Bacteroidales bacterium]
MTVCLTGFMGCGKTSVGRELSRQLGWKFLDLDEEIERREGRTVSDIFADDGEPAFREIEALVLSEVIDGAGGENLILALGGGATLRDDSRRKVLEKTTCVYLQCPLEEILNRFSPASKPRPLLGAGTENIYKARLPIYEQAPVHICTSGRDKKETAVRIRSLLGLKASQ